MSGEVGIERVDLASRFDPEIDRQTEIAILPAQSLAEIALAELREVHTNDSEDGVPKRVFVATEDFYRDVAGKLER